MIAVQSVPSVGVIVLGAMMGIIIIIIIIGSRSGLSEICCNEEISKLS